MAWWGLICGGLLALCSLETGALGSRQMWSFDKECQFSALQMFCVLKEGAPRGRRPGSSLQAHELGCQKRLDQGM